MLFFSDKKQDLCIDVTFCRRKGRYINDEFGETQNVKVKLVKVWGKNNLAVLATRDIKSGEQVLFFSDKKQDLCIDVTFCRRKGRYINDEFGETQNVQVKLVKVWGKNNLAVLATRDIKSGEQVLFFSDKKQDLCIDVTFCRRKGRYINDGFVETQNVQVKLNCEGFGAKTILQS